MNVMANQLKTTNQFWSHYAAVVNLCALYYT